jgi:hypothetical protein
VIYVACLVNSEHRGKAPSDVETTGDKLFPLLCSSIRTNVQNTWHDNPIGARTEAG